MKIAITGATGGLGRNLAQHFKNKGHEVTALGRNRQIGKELEAGGISFFPGELSDQSYLDYALADQEVIIHSAALASPWGPWQNFEAANVVGTANVLRAARTHSLQRFVHISTPSIYFSGQPAHGLKEDDPLPKPWTHYARSKLLAEALVREAVDQHRLPALILRPRAIFGPHDTSILPRLLRMMERGVFPLFAGGSAHVEVTAVQNVLHAIELCLKADQSFFGRSYNITNDEPMTVKDLAHLIAQELQLKVKFIPLPFTATLAFAKALEFFAGHLTHREPLLTQYSVGLLGVTQTLDISRAKQELGYKPVVDVRTALKEFAVWWRQNNAR